MTGTEVRMAEEEGALKGFFFTGLWLPVFIMGVDLFLNKGIPSIEYYTTAGLLIVVLMVSVAWAARLQAHSNQVGGG